VPDVDVLVGGGRYPGEVRAWTPTAKGWVAQVQWRRTAGENRPPTAPRTGSGEPSGYPADMTEILRTDQLEVGDLIVGPGHRVVRIDTITPLDDDSIELRSTASDAERDHTFEIGERLTGQGQAPSKLFAVLGRGVPKEAVQIDGLR
jgi:hypothetical protein